MIRVLAWMLPVCLGIGAAVWAMPALPADYEEKSSDFVQIIPATDEAKAKNRDAIAEVIYSNGVNQGSVAWTYRVELMVDGGEGERQVRVEVKVIPNKPEPGVNGEPERYMGREYAAISIEDPAFMAFPVEGWVPDGEFLRFLIVPGLM